jgi:hypothetical protein
VAFSRERRTASSPNVGEITDDAENAIDALTLGTVNAALRRGVPAEELACAIRAGAARLDGRLALATATFFLEVPAETRLLFLVRHDITDAQATAAATSADGAA